MPHSKKTVFLFALALIVVGMTVAAVHPAGAALPTSREIRLQVHLPGTSPCTDPVNAGSYCVQDFGEYLMNFYRWFVSITGVLAIAMIILGGFRWITAAGDSGKITEAKDMMEGALSGVVLIMISFLFLQLINPQILSLRLPIGDIEKIDFKLGQAFCAGREIEQTGLSCGDVATLKTSTATRKESCIYEGNCTATGQICTLKNASDATSWACQTLTEACLNTDKNDCNRIDSQLASSNDPSIKSYSCAKADIPSAGDGCRAGKVLPTLYTWKETPEGISDAQYKCPKAINNSGNNDSARVSCSLAGKAVSGTISTDCWDEDYGPKTPTIPVVGTVPTTSAGARPKCSDSPRANEQVNSACCALYLKKDINCKADRKGSDVEVDCAYYDIQPGKYESGGVDPDDDGNETCTTKCWMELYLYHPGTVL